MRHDSKQWSQWSKFSLNMPTIFEQIRPSDPTSNGFQVLQRPMADLRRRRVSSHGASVFLNKFLGRKTVFCYRYIDGTFPPCPIHSDLVVCPVKVWVGETWGPRTLRWHTQIHDMKGMSWPPWSHMDENVRRFRNGHPRTIRIPAEYLQILPMWRTHRTPLAPSFVLPVQDSAHGMWVSRLGCESFLYGFNSTTLRKIFGKAKLIASFIPGICIRTWKEGALSSRLIMTHLTTHSFFFGCSKSKLSQIHPFPHGKWLFGEGSSGTPERPPSEPRKTPRPRSAASSFHKKIAIKSTQRLMWDITKIW